MALPGHTSGGDIFGERKSARLLPRPAATIKAQTGRGFMRILVTNDDGINAPGLRVLEAMGLPKNRIHGVLRLSLSRETTDPEIDRVLELLPRIVERLRGLG